METLSGYGVCRLSFCALLAATCLTSRDDGVGGVGVPTDGKRSPPLEPLTELTEVLTGVPSEPVCCAVEVDASV